MKTNTTIASGMNRLKAQAAKWFAMIALTGLVFMASSCSSDDEQSTGEITMAKEPAGEEAASAKTDEASQTSVNSGDIKVVTMNNGAYEDEDEKLAEQDLVIKYWEKMHPGTTLEFQPWQYEPEVFIPKVQSGTSTDIVGLFATEGAMVIQKGLAMDLSPFIEKWDMGQYLIPAILKPYQREGKTFGLPVGDLTGAYVMTLFYNKKLFKEYGIVDDKGEAKPPQTWDEFVETAIELTDRDRGLAGFGILGDANAAGWHFLNWVWQAGGEFEEQQPDGTWKSAFGSAEAGAALQFVKDLRWKHDVLQRNLLCNNDDLMEMFVGERIAMSFFAPENLIYLYDKYEMSLDDIGITILPAGPGGRANQMGGNFNIIIKGTPQETAQLAFDYLTDFTFNLDVLEARCKLRKEQNRVVGVPSLPVFQPEVQTKINAVIDKYRTFPDYTDLMNEAAKYVRAEPPHFAQALYSEFLSSSVQKVLIDENADAPSLMKKASEDFQKQYLDGLNKEILAEKQ